MLAVLVLPQELAGQGAREARGEHGDGLAVVVALGKGAWVREVTLGLVHAQVIHGGGDGDKVVGGRVGGSARCHVLVQVLGNGGRGGRERVRS